ncbi:MAG: esterase [Bacteroidia bacterium]|nr:esterase [Bacteroidia bacterium]
MNLRLFYILLILSGFNKLSGQIIGQLKTISSFKSVYVDARRVDFWMPEGIPKNTKLSVLYMHDGQMLFDSTQTWNHQEWKVDEGITNLFKAGKIPAILVVAIWNNGAKRHFEYMPELALKQNLSHAEQDTLLNLLHLQRGRGGNDSTGFLAEAYLNFITKELMPYVSKNYSIKKGKENTLIMGSSMGGIISLYALCRYPAVFGKSASLSMHWPILFNSNTVYPEAFLKYLRTQLPDPSKGNKIYIDSGTETLDALYPKWLKRSTQLLDDLGYPDGQYRTKIFEAEDHSEKSWSKRFPKTLEFLLQNH